MWYQPTLPTWPTWILLIFCQVNVPIKKWKSWKFYLLLMKGFKIMTTWTIDPLAWTTNHYNLWHFETALIQPVLIVNIWNFEWGLIFWKYLLQKTFLVKILKIIHLWWSAKIVKLTTSMFFFTFSVGYNFIKENPDGLQLIAAILYQDISELKMVSFESDQL